MVVLPALKVGLQTVCPCLICLTFGIFGQPCQGRTEWAAKLREQAVTSGQGQGPGPLMAHRILS